MSLRVDRIVQGGSDIPQLGATPVQFFRAQQGILKPVILTLYEPSSVIAEKET